MIIAKLFWWLKVKVYKKKLKNCGNNVIISYPITIMNPNNISVGNNVYIGPGAWVSALGKVVFGNGVIVGPRLKIYTGNHNYDSDIAIPYDSLTIVKKVVIEENVWIGGDVILLPGVKIGEGAIVGGGAVVTRDVLPGEIVGGNPAKVIKRRDMEKYFKLKQENKIYLELKSKKILVPYFEER